MSARMRMPAGDDDDWAALVGLRRQQIARFLSWAAEREVVNSMRLANRRDVARVREITDAFGEPWWAAVVYSCFDSEVGTLAVADAFHDPVGANVADRLLSDIELPVGAVRGHRTQPAHKGAKVALSSACARAQAFESILNTGSGLVDRPQHPVQWIAISRRCNSARRPIPHVCSRCSQLDRPWL